MFVGFIGIAILIWALWAGIGTRENNRAVMFQGPVGYFLNLIVIVTAIICMFVGFL